MNSSISKLDGTLKDTANLGQRQPGSNGNEEVFLKAPGAFVSDAV